MIAGAFRHTALALLMAVLLAFSGAGGAAAQQTGADTSPPDAVQQLEELVRTIEDEQQRQELLVQLRALIEARRAQEPEEAAPGGLFERLASQVDRLGDEFGEAVRALSNVGQVWRWARVQAGDPEKRSIWLEALWKILAALAAGLVAEAILTALLRGARGRVETRETDGLFTRLFYLALRTLLDIFPIAAFAGAAYVTLPFLEPSRSVSEIALAIILASVISRAIKAAARMLLAPRVASLRIFHLRDETARYLFVWIGRFTTIIVYGYFALIVARDLGLSQAAFDALFKLLGLIVTGLLLVFIMQNRKEVAAWLRGDQGATDEAAAPGSAGSADVAPEGRRFRPLLGVRRRVADIWHILAALYVLASFIVWLLDIGGGFAFLATATALTAVTVMIAWLVHAALMRAVNRALRVDTDLARVSPGLEARANRYLPFLRTGISAIVGVVALLAILQVWGADVVGWFRTESGRALLGSVITIVIVLIAALVVWELVSGAIERYMRREEQKDESERVARIETLLPLARNAILVVLVIVVTMTVMAELGIDIGPLLAGAGVVGLAIGFGAQSLVKDLITGIFNLIEDTVAVGDIVDVGGGHIGVVESVSIRSVRLRDYSGIVHTVPFGDVTSVQNYTKEYAQAVLDIGVAYRENVDEVIQVMRDVGAEMRDDEEYGAYILDDLEIAGVNEFADSAVVVRARFRVAPGRQWTVRREYFRRIKAAFDEKGIEIPFPHVTLYFGEDKEGNAPPGLVRLLQNGKPAKEAPAPPAAAEPAPPPDDSRRAPPGEGDGE